MYCCRLVNPELVTYPNALSDEVIANASQLGAPVVVSFVVRNSGPSTIGTISLTVNWPLNATDSGNNYVIYPAQISVRYICKKKSSAPAIIIVWRARFN